MKLINRLFISVVIIAGLTSCEDMLDTKKTNDWTADIVWTNPDMAQAVLTQVYGNMMVWPDNLDGNFLDAATDNALTRNYGSVPYRAGMGAFSPSADLLGCWNNCYTQIQTINLFMENGLTDDVLYSVVNPETDQLIKNRLLGEAHFLRAWYNFRLLQTYGGRTSDGQAMGIVIMNKFIGDKEEANPLNYDRATYEASVNQIVADCEKAIELLPMVYTGADVVIGASKIGRASGLAAQALKAKTLLYAASPAYQNSSVINLTAMGEFTVIDASTYQNGWEKAALYANEVLKDAGINYNFTAMTAANLADGTKDNPADFILRSFLGMNRDLENRHYPPFYMGNAQTIPSHNLATAFPAVNGFPITDPRSGYNEDDPYSLNRDRRFNMNLYYHGAKFGAYDSHIDVSEGGKDSEGFHIHASRSGYYLSKFLSRTQKDMLNPIQPLTSRHYSPHLRKTEVWLNYAEAANEAWGPDGKGADCRFSAYDVIKMVRERSGGITDVTYLDEAAASKEEFRKLIQNERRIEFSFEGQRFWDLRRCLLPLNTPIEGMKVTRATTGYNYAVERIEERPLNEIRLYYLPLPHDETLKNPKLVNNMGWD